MRNILWLKKLARRALEDEMSEVSKSLSKLPPDQQAIRDKCFHPSGTFVEFPIEDVETSIPARFEKIVEMYPDRLAVKSGARSYTYDELNRAANRIAWAIMMKRGAGSEMIALQFEHGIDAIAAILGALKAGKYFVALDPSLPYERSAAILEDSQALLIVTNHGNADVARNLAGSASTWLNIDDSLESVSSRNLGIGLSPDDLAIMTYTSGSTGKPKGVVRAHRSFLQSFVMNANEMRICPEDRLTLFHSIGFASAYSHLFASLLCGASLFPFDIKSEGIHRLPNWLQEEQITVCHFPLSAFRQATGSLAKQRNSSTVRLLRLSGAPITGRDFDLYKESFPPQTLLGIAMGSTETAGICFATVDQNFSFPTEGTPVGYPRPGKEVLLLDEGGQKVDPGEVGEIAVKDRNLSPGYWRNPGLTSSKFLADTSGGEERIYLTGDLGRMLPDGFLIHLGRKDFQVKIRGYRVELGEIETALVSHPRIREAAVAAWDRDGEKELAAYVVPAENPLPPVNELRDFLGGTLPVYMLPSTFTFVKSLSLTNGKLDRTALPSPDHKRPHLEQPYAPPQNEVEKKLVRIWQEVLNVRPIGIDDNFFDLGGHSLLAAKLFVRLDDEFGRLLPLSVLLVAPTVRLLAEHYRSPTQPRKISRLVPLVPTGSLPPVYAVPGVFGNVVGFVDLARELGPRQPFYGLQSMGLDGAQAPLDSVEEMAKLYLSEIHEIQPHGPYALIGACFGSSVAYEMTRQLHEAGEEVMFLGLFDPIGLARHEGAESLLSGPPTFSRARVLGSFVTDRLRLYREELRWLDDRDRVRFIGTKIRSLSAMIKDSRTMRGVRREVHELAVFEASKLAGRKYYRRPLNGCLRSLEIFESAHPRNNNKEWAVDWKPFWNGETIRHRMPGKDSGDMISGENARVLAALLAERLRAAFIQQSGGVDLPQSQQCARPD
jgi:amino acid adenylation domain-containing protein